MCCSRWQDTSTGFSDGPTSNSFLFTFQENGNFSGGSIQSIASFSFQPLGLVQAVPRGGNDNDRWLVTTGQYQSAALGLNSQDYGNFSSDTNGLAPVDLPYGIPGDSDDSNWKAVLGGSVAGGLVLLVIVTLAVRRWLWPQWRDRAKDKLIEILTKDEQVNGDFGGKNELPEDGGDEYKVEETSAQTFDLNGRDKILVDEDMELDEFVIDVNAAYMGGVGLENHRRPTVVTTLHEDSER